VARRPTRTFTKRDLSGVGYLYLWADGMHVNIRLEGHKLCLLVVIGVRADGRKELVALVDGYRESTESWADLLRDAERRGMRTPVLAAGDGALGFWGACQGRVPSVGGVRPARSKTYGADIGCWRADRAALAGQARIQHRSVRQVAGAEMGSRCARPA
jgi:Transposase, Mutator family